MFRLQNYNLILKPPNSPEVISNTPNRNLNSPKVIFVTLGGFCFYAERLTFPDLG
jgi:hypothetical protein